MDLNGYITKAVEVTGTIRELSDRLQIPANAISDAKRGTRGIPAFACVKLAQLIGEDERRVIAASELVTEKNPERRAVWLPFVTEIAQAARRKTAQSVKGAGEAVIFHL